MESIVKIFNSFQRINYTFLYFAFHTKFNEFETLHSDEFPIFLFVNYFAVHKKCPVSILKCIANQMGRCAMDEIKNINKYI